MDETDEPFNMANESLDVSIKLENEKYLFNENIPFKTKMEYELDNQNNVDVNNVTLSVVCKDNKMIVQERAINQEEKINIKEEHCVNPLPFFNRDIKGGYVCCILSVKTTILLKI